MMGELLVPECSPVGLRPTAAPMRACEVERGHSHNYDHITVVLAGRIRVEASYADGAAPFQVEEYRKGEQFVVRAAVWHTITAMEDGTEYLCVFSHRDFGGVVVEHYAGNAAAYE